MSEGSDRHSRITRQPSVGEDWDDFLRLDILIIYIIVSRPLEVSEKQRGHLVTKLLFEPLGHESLQ